MRMRIILSLLLAVNVAGYAQESPATEIKQYTIGEKSVSIPAPVGYVDGTEVSPDTHKWAVSITPPSNRLVTLFLSVDDAALAAKGEEPELQRYMVIQTYRQTETMTMGAKEFEELAKILRNQQKQVFKDAKDKHNEGNVSALKVNDIIPHGIFLDTPTAMAMAVVTKYNFGEHADAIGVPVACGISFTVVEGKFLYLYVYSIYTGPDDVEWVKNKSKEWIETITRSEKKNK